MIFSSLFFLFLFLPLVLLSYYLLPQSCRNAALFLASLIFYAWGEPIYIWLMLFSIVINYLYGLLLARYEKQPKLAKIILYSSLALNLGLLFFFKYADLISQSINFVFGTALQELNLPLPIGISFYTFQTLSYLLDLYRAEVLPQRNLIAFGTYVSLFPQLIAGPIVRYQTVAEQLLQRREDISSFGRGVSRLIIGLAKKVLLANNLGLLWQEVQQLPAAELTISGAWLGIIAFALQLYFDFSGYSDMAIGLGQMFGFTFLENFNYPYLAQSITDFWRRWHISLGTWFREYVYIPLGGNRRGPRLMYRNLLVVWCLTGLWHGASWNFMLWGLYFGLILAMEKAFLGRWLQLLPCLLRHLYAKVLILLGWVLFVFTDLVKAGQYWQAMFGFNSNGWLDQQTLYLLTNYGLLLALAVLCSVPWSKKTIRWGENISPAWTYAAAVAAQILLLMLTTAYLVDSTYNPFLYFRF
ncbi:MAG TPA: MBOAT family O-acyltransferase [Oscillospiraceae bacterium]|nr:MBOAT family O-acyltransferase [Oscillospiraceae bacterium]